MYVVVLSNQYEQEFINSITTDQHGNKQLKIQPSKAHEFMNRVKDVFDAQAKEGRMPVLLTSQYVRIYVRSIIQRFRPSIAVISQHEIHYKVNINTVATI